MNTHETCVSLEREKLNKNLDILTRVAEKLIGGQLHSGNIAHDAPIKGYTIQNCINNIRKLMEERTDEYT